MLKKNTIFGTTEKWLNKRDEDSTFNVLWKTHILFGMYRDKSMRCKNSGVQFFDSKRLSPNIRSHLNLLEITLSRLSWHFLYPYFYNSQFLFFYQLTAIKLQKHAIHRKRLLLNVKSTKLFKFFQNLHKWFHDKNKSLLQMQ